MKSSWADYRERYTPRNYATVVTRNKISAYFQQRQPYVTFEDETLEHMISEQAVEKGPLDTANPPPMI